MENNKDNMANYIRKLKLIKILKNVKQELPILLGENIDYVVIEDINKIDSIVNTAFSKIENKQRNNDSIRLQNITESMIQCEKLLSCSNQGKAIVLIYVQGAYCAIEMSLCTIKHYLIKLWDLSEGDIVIAQNDLLKGICLEFNHYYNKDEYEITFW